MREVKIIGLGIKDYDDIYREYSIPLIWDDNKTLAKHFKMLADTVEKFNKPILEVKLSTPIGNTETSKPSLEIITFKQFPSLSNKKTFYRSFFMCLANT